jgi:predicted DNA binding CopG/RHH family protein
MSRKLEDLSGINIDHFDKDTELWEARKLGASAKHAKRSSKKHDQELDSALGLQLCTFRIQTELVEQLRHLARREGMGYQTFMRQILTNYVARQQEKLDKIQPETRVVKKYRRAG